MNLSKRTLVPVLALAVGAFTREANHPAISPMIGVWSAVDQNSLTTEGAKDHGVTTGAWINSYKDRSFSVQSYTTGEVISDRAVGFFGPTVKTLDCDGFNGVANVSKTINGNLVIMAGDEVGGKALTVIIDGEATAMNNGGLQNCRLKYDPRGSKW
jgi:hypothetical protein